ncbi:MAG: hypothetical protein ABF545_05655 [Bifidobacterium psychraerophilum]|uniref:hypothetical protein n=1 Tax=Bifidobacterium psychraerophilum TaxID=218140 RepID=UPI0039E8BE90
MISRVSILNNSSMILVHISTVLGIVGVIATRAKGKKSDKTVTFIGVVLSAMSVADKEDLAAEHVKIISVQKAGAAMMANPPL